VILAGRAINDYMPKHVAEMAIKGLNEVGKVIKGAKILIMGLTYKENVPDTRESPVREMVNELKEFGVDVYGYDTLLSREEIERFGVKVLDKLDVKVDCVIVAVAHDAFREIAMGDLKEMMNGNPVLVDVRGMFDGEEAEEKGFYYKTL
jgi:UDPglucose 6-dehydrogenase/UDP-N-acetyl-D-galactosamine dehydrogenase